MKQIKLEIHPGGAWEGHVWFMAINPDDAEDIFRSNFISNIKDWAEERGFSVNPKIDKIIKDHLIFDKEHGCFIIPLKHIDENRFWSSASDYLNKVIRPLLD